MVLRGHVQNGMIVLDEPAQLPEGAAVRVLLAESEESGTALDETGQTLGQKLLKHAGKATGRPADAAENHDHYLYRTPKR